MTQAINKLKAMRKIRRAFKRRKLINKEIKITPHLDFKEVPTIVVEEIKEENLRQIVIDNVDS
jgi:hypothetical protein